MSDDSVPNAYFSCSSHLPPSQDSSNPKPMDASSVFADDSCGEPLIAQHVVIDFTPNDGDNDFVQKKVCSFWQFINSHPEIQNLKVKPDKKVYTEDSTTGIPTVSSPAKGKNATKIPDKQALEMLEFAGEKKFVNAALDPKLRQRTCSFGSLDYQQREIITQPKKQGKIKHVCKCIPCRNPSCRNKKPSSVSRDEISPLKAINRMMDKWDAKHPKLLDLSPSSFIANVTSKNGFSKYFSKPGVLGPFSKSVIRPLEPWLVPNAVPMFSVSPYAFHPLIHRFVRIWEYVQVVSDMITFALSIICCQCGDAMPLSTSESVNSKPSVQVFDLRALNRRFGPITAEEDPVRSSKEPIKPPHLVIDFPPDKDDHPETQTRCQSIWHCDQNRSGLEDITIVQSPKPPSAGHMIELSKDPVHSGKAKEQSNSHLPAIHNSRTINKKDSLKDSKIGAVNMFY